MNHFTDSFMFHKIKMLQISSARHALIMSYRSHAVGKKNVGNCIKSDFQIQKSSPIGSGVPEQKSRFPVDIICGSAVPCVFRFMVTTHSAGLCDNPFRNIIITGITPYSLGFWRTCTRSRVSVTLLVIFLYRFSQFGVSSASNLLTHPARCIING